MRSEKLSRGRAATARAMLRSVAGNCSSSAEAASLACATVSKNVKRSKNRVTLCWRLALATSAWKTLWTEMLRQATPGLAASHGATCSYCLRQAVIREYLTLSHALYITWHSPIGRSTSLVLTSSATLTTLYWTGALPDLSMSFRMAKGPSASLGSSCLSIQLFQPSGPGAFWPGGSGVWRVSGSL